MKWHVKIWLSPMVQEEPEEWDDISLEQALAQIWRFFAPEGWGKPWNIQTLREIRITKAPDAPQE